jgi:hypothetical protein
LPEPFLIIEPAKAAYMICIIFPGFCGGGQFKPRALEKRRRVGRHKVIKWKKIRYALDMGIL